MKTAAVLLGLVMAGSAINAEDIESCRDSDHKIAVPDNVPTVVASIVLPPGHWEVKGSVTMYEIAARGTVFAGFNVDSFLRVTPDGNTIFQSLVIPWNQPTNATIAGTPSRLFRNVTEPTTVYLVAWSHEPGQPPPNASAFGCIRANRP